MCVHVFVRVCEYVGGCVHACMCCCIYMVSDETRRGHQIPWDRSCRFLCANWEENLGPLEEKPGHLSSSYICTLCAFEVLLRDIFILVAHEHHSVI